MHEYRILIAVPVLEKQFVELVRLRRILTAQQEARDRLPISLRRRV